MGAPAAIDERIPAAELGPVWVELEGFAEAGAFAKVRECAAVLAKDLEAREGAGEGVDALRARLRETIEHGRNRAFEVGMEAVGRSFVGLYEAAAKMQGENPKTSKKKRRRRKPA
ncbi:MAG: hypothetical protein AAFX94_25410 [Myxococcota bacterium]